MGLHINGFVGTDSTTPDQNGIDKLYIYVYWAADDLLVKAGQTDAGFIQKVWVPYPKMSDVYVFVSYDGSLTAMPDKSEFNPPYYKWFHNEGEQTVTVTFYLK